MRITRSFTSAARRWGQWAKALLLVCALMAGLAITASAAFNDLWQQGVVVDPAAPKPVVTIQGNLVKEKGKPTGFYELALCVRSGRDIYGPHPDKAWADDWLTEKDFYNVARQIKMGTAPAGLDLETSYTFKYYPFYSASASVNINTEILTAVDWDLQEVKYGKIDPMNPAPGYDPTLCRYPWGIDTSAAVQGYTMPEWRAFPDITEPDLYDFDHKKVALDVEGDTRMYTVEGAVEHFDEDDQMALVTLSASAPDNHPIILTEDTPLVVARFSYDLNRFKVTDVGKDWEDDLRNDATGDVAGDGLWMGWDLRSGKQANSDMIPKTALTWLGESVDNSAFGGDPYDFTDSDEMAAMSSVNQSVWVHAGAEDVYGVATDTNFYYYLGAEDLQKNGTETDSVLVGNTLKDIPGIARPNTEGAVVLTEGTAENTLAPIAPYSYFVNLLRLEDNTLVLRLVNEPTFRKPTGGTGGTQILFYDWDDTLIGAMIVDKGDVRAEVNAYIEETMVHPDLRTGTLLTSMGGSLPANLDTLASPSGTTDPAEQYKGIIDSLDREWTYRGKYPYTVGGPITEERADGKEYPLTNKLDYAFYRHLDTATTLEYVDSDGVDTVDRYITSAALSSDPDAALYPWVYGWAVVEDNSALNQTSWTVRRDAAQVGNVWTTFNVGELEKLDPTYDVLADPKSQAVPTALPAGATAAAGTTLGTVSGVNGLDTVWPGYVDTTTAVAPTVYSYKLSTADGNGYLRFADFSDVDKELTRDGQNVLVVKAVYEPGASLLSSGYVYTIADGPHYNKKNTVPAEQGAVYTAKITFQRANGELGNIQGVTRMRQPEIRMDATIDQWWIVSDNPAVDHDLSAPSLQVAKDRTETTYVKFDMDNVDEFTVELYLSPRQNRINYYLMETTALKSYNLIEGAERTATNLTKDRDSAEWLKDNYNYLDGDSNSADVWYDAPYANRNGSRGFVLDGTLNSMMQKATEVNNGKITTAQFNTATLSDSMQDANLRTDLAGTQPSASGQVTIRTAMRNAATAAAAFKGTADEALYWDKNLDCARLNYHQIQWYIIEGTLYSPSAADAKKLPFCHLHKECAAEAEGKPTSWKDLIAKAGDPSTQSGIAKLTGAEISELTYLRKADGTVYRDSDATAFKDSIVAAVAAGATSWDDVQYYIIHGAMPTDGGKEARETYWWYDDYTSTTRSDPTTFAALLTASKDAVTAPKLPDGSNTVLRTAKIKDVGKAAFTANAALGVDETDTAWNRLTTNLVASRVVNADKTENTVKFADHDTFMAEYLDALMEAAAAGVDSPTWEQIQYHILHKGDAGYIFPATPDATQTKEMKGYWWKNGKEFLKVKDLVTLLDAAKKVNAGDETGLGAWDRFEISDLYNSAMPELHFRYNFHGDQFTDTPTNAGDPNDFEEFKNAVLDFVKNSVVTIATSSSSTSQKDISWNQLQYYLIHPDASFGSGASLNAAVDKEKMYYWWKDGQIGQEYTLGTGAADSDVEKLMEALYRDVVNGNQKALDQLTDTMAWNLRLIPSYAGTEKDLTELTKYDTTTVATLKTKLRDMWTAGSFSTDKNDANYYGKATWRQVQHYLLTGTWLAASDPALPKDDETLKGVGTYWWRKGTANPDVATGPIPSKLDEFLAHLEARMQRPMTGTTAVINAADDPLKTAIDTYFTNDVLSIYGGSATAILPWSQMNALQQNTVKTRILNMCKAMYNKMGKTTVYGNVDWYVIQYYALNNIAATATTMVDPATAKNYYNNTIMVTGKFANTTAMSGDWAAHKGQLANTAPWKPSYVDDEPVKVQLESDGTFTVVTGMRDFVEVPLPGVEFPVLNAAAAMAEQDVPMPVAPELTVDEQIAQAEQEFLAAWEKLQELQALKESQEAEAPAETEPEITNPAWDIDSWPTAPLEDAPETPAVTAARKPAAKPSEAEAPAENVGADAHIGPETPDLIDLIPEGAEPEPAKAPVKTEADGTVDITVVDKAPAPVSLNLKVSLDMTPLLLAAIGWQSLGKRKKRRK